MRQSSKKYFFVIIILLIIFVIINIVPGLTSGLGNFLFKIFSPMEKFFIRAGEKLIGFFEVFLSISELNKQNTGLRQRNLELETEVSQLKEVKRENEVLRQGLGISKKGQSIIEMASVVGKDVQGAQDWILIDRGEKQGIEKNMAVISSETALVGKVIETMSDFSKVMLITNKENVVAALVEGGRSEGLVKKSEKGKLFMDFIPRGEELEAGERIITSGMDNIYPKGILIGKIEDIDLSQNQLFQKITIIPIIDFSKLEEVFIVRQIMNNE
jgi:rod shape-determining protein MreC